MWHCLRKWDLNVLELLLDGAEFFLMEMTNSQVKLLKAVEDAAKAKGVKIPLIDGYRNARMTEKLELSAKMPALVELRKGAVAKVTTVASEADVQKALA